MAAVIAIDAMGGDAAPGPEVAGAVDAVRNHGSQVVLVRLPRALPLVTCTESGRIVSFSSPLTV